MTFHRMQHAAALAAAMAALGCGSNSAPTASGGSGGYTPKNSAPSNPGIAPAGEEASYFPFAVGNQWTFDSETSRSVNGRLVGTTKGEITWRVVKLTPTPDGGQEATIDSISNGTATEQMKWRIDKTGLYQVGSGKGKAVDLSSPQPIVPFPVKPGQTFNWSGTNKSDAGEVHTSLKGVVNGSEPIDTSMGSFNGLSISQSGPLKSDILDATLTTKLWLIPNYGLGRYLQSVEGKLTSKDPKLKGKSANLVQIEILKLKNRSFKK